MINCECTPDLPDGRSGKKCYLCVLIDEVSDSIEDMKYLQGRTDSRCVQATLGTLVKVQEFLKYGGNDD